MSNKYLPGWRGKLGRIIFEVDTPAGRWFDIVLLWAIVISVLLVMLESVQDIYLLFESEIRYGEWFFTILFTIEYVLRVMSSPRPLKYIFSFYGLIDLVSIIPTYLSFYFTGTESLLAIRTIRLLRVFRVLKLVRYLKEAQLLIDSLKHSRPKIIVFLVAVLGVATIMGTMMYIIEGAEAGFTSIPRSIYWSIVTMTTVGYGDISPDTPLGQPFASILMIMGYAIIAVPTGIISAEAVLQSRERNKKKDCPACNHAILSDSAKYCENCGGKLGQGTG